MLHFLPSLRSFAKSPEFFGLGPRSYTNLHCCRSWDSSKVLRLESEGGRAQCDPRVTCFRFTWSACGI